MQDALRQARARRKWALFFLAIMIAAIMAANMVRDRTQTPDTEVTVIQVGTGL